MERPALAGPIPRSSRFETGVAGPRAARERRDDLLTRRWPIAAGIGVALIGPTLAIAAGKWWGTAVAVTVTVAGVLALALLVALAVRQRESWIQARARQEMLEAARRAAMDVASAALSASDWQTAEHSEEVAQLCDVLCEEFGIEGDERMRVLMAAHLHDIGKVSVSSEILNKPGPLNADEWAVIKEHTLVGERILEAVPELNDAAALVRHSHEHWNGSGYPDGLAGDEIPLGSRVVLAADAFHAIRSDRPYRRGRSPREALLELRAHAGSQFDPLMVAALERQATRLHLGLGARIPLSRRTVALLIGGILLLAGTALATGLLPLSKPDAEPPAAPLPERGAEPAKAKRAPSRVDRHFGRRTAAGAEATHARTAHPARRRGPVAKSEQPAPSGAAVPEAQAPASSPSRGPDFLTPVRARGNPVQANGVAVGRPPTVTPQGNGAGLPGGPKNAGT